MDVIENGPDESTFSVEKALGTFWFENVGPLQTLIFRLLRLLMVEAPLWRIRQSLGPVHLRTTLSVVGKHAKTEHQYKEKPQNRKEKNGLGSRHPKNWSKTWSNRKPQCPHSSPIHRRIVHKESNL